MCVLQCDTQSPCSSCSLSTGVHCKVQIRLLHHVLACYFPFAFFKLSCIHYSQLYLKRAVLLCTFPRSLAYDLSNWWGRFFSISCCLGEPCCYQVKIPLFRTLSSRQFLLVTIQLFHDIVSHINWYFTQGSFKSCLLLTIPSPDSSLF